MFITIEGTVPAQKNNKTVGTNRVTGKIFVTSSKTVKSWQKEAEKQLKLYGYRFTNEFGLTMEFFNPDKRPRDLDNQVSTVLDALVKAGIIIDDSCKYLKMITAIYGGVDKENPRVVIDIDEATPKIVDNNEPDR